MTNEPATTPAAPAAITIEAAIARHLAHLRALAFTPATLDARAWHLSLFRRWADERGVSAVADLTPDIIARWQRHMSQQRKPDGHPLASLTQRARLVALRVFARWLARERLTAADPAAALIMPRVGQPLPKAWLSAAQVETVLAQTQPDGRRPRTGLRDRAILETLYSTGLRRAELARLAVHDVDFAGGALIVRKGKGRKDRVVPIGERALAWIEKYLADARPALARGNDAEATLFLSERGKPLTVGLLSSTVTRYLSRAGFAKSGSCHLFRHTCATLMLEGGADVRHVQEQLGHANLQTTQIYTHVSISRLKEVHAATHPAAKLAPRARDGGL